MAKQKKKLFLLLDGNAILHRAWHALPPLQAPDGTLVNAVYGFANVLQKLRADLDPAYMAVAWDLPGPTFRHKQYKEYKATRVKKEDELYNQIPIIQDLLDALDIPYFSEEGYEADDVIGTIAEKLIKKDLETYIVTGDLDALQLVDPTTKVLFFIRGVSETKLYDEAAVRERYGFDPEQLIDYKALRGDPSDNIPGVAGVGDKTASILVKKYGDIKKLYKAVDANNVPEVTPRILGRLADDKDNALMSYELATIVRDIPMEFKLSDSQEGTPNEGELRNLLSGLGFKSLLKKFGISENIKIEVSPEGPQKKVATFSSGDDIGKIVEILSKEKEIALLAGIDKEGQLAALGVATNQLSYTLQNPSKEQLKSLQPVLENENIKKVGHDLKELIHIFNLEGIELRGVWFDIMIASYLLNPGSRRHDVQSISHEFLSKQLPEMPDNFGYESDYHVIAEIVGNYFPLVKVLESELKSVGMLDLFFNIEMPVVEILAEAEMEGIKIDKDFLAKLSKKMGQRIDQLTKKIHKLAGGEFNVKSPIQLSEILFDKLEIPTKGLKKTKTGISTAAPELEKIRDAHPMILLIFEHRELAKLKSTYVDALPELADPDDRVHTSFNQTVTSTGRLSSSEPNLQNIPIRTELGREIRKAFVVSHGKILLAADYSQIELRLVSVIAGDQGMINAFKAGADIHRQTAAEIAEVKPDDVTKEMRRAAKAVNFGIIYGIGPKALAVSAGVSFSEAKEFIARYFEVHHKVKDYLDETKVKAHTDGYVETIFGRRRYLPEINSGVQMVRAAAERMAINMPIQGAGADIMKMAMIEVDKWIKSQKDDKIKMLLQVHDELVFEVDKDFVEKAGKEIKRIMESVHQFDVPLVVDVESGKNWGSLK